MQIARVVGTVVSTIKNGSLEGRKFLIVQTLDADLNEKGKPMVALDSVGAGVGELVFWCRGKEASFPFKRDEIPDGLHYRWHNRFRRSHAELRRRLRYASSKCLLPAL
jgi:microcompartment protein CcmK/EutM